MARGSWGRAARAAVGLLAGCALFVACSETKRPLGEDCLKGDDCLSGVCSGLRCAGAPVLLDGSPEQGADAAGSDGAGDGSPEASPDSGSTGDAADAAEVE